jgi:hypothetical protein
MRYVLENEVEEKTLKARLTNNINYLTLEVYADGKWWYVVSLTKRGRLYFHNGIDDQTGLDLEEEAKAILVDGSLY